MRKELNDKELDAIIPFSGPAGGQLMATEQLISSGRALQRVSTGYTTAVAVQKARSIARIQNNVLEEADLAGKEFYWGWNVQTKNGKRWIEGPSIDLAMCLARHYGNCALDIEAEETLTHFMLKGIFIDLESGFTCPRLYRQRKNQGMGGKMDEDADRKEDIVFQIGQSKALRNAVANAMPSWLIKKAIERAKEAAKKEIQDLPSSRAKALKYFMDKGATQERIEAAMEKPADQWSADDILELNAMRIALNESRVTIKELFPDIKPQEPTIKTPPQAFPNDEESNKEPKWYPCPVEGCEFHAVSERGLKKHITQSHTGSDPEPAEEPEPLVKGDEPEPKDKNPSWNGLWRGCPDMGASPGEQDGNPIPVARCVNCKKREGCPNPWPIPDGDAPL
jgi:hypothetical protein